MAENLYGKSCTPNLGGISDYYTKEEVRNLLKSRTPSQFLEENHVALGNQSDISQQYELNPDSFSINHTTKTISVVTSLSDIPVSSLVDGLARQVLQTASNGTTVEWTSNLDLPGTLDVTGLATFDNKIKINTAEPTASGEVGWDPDQGTLDVGLLNGVTTHVGQDHITLCRNGTVSSIPKGTGVMFAGTLGNSGRIKIAPMVANGTYPGYVFFGVTAQDIAAGADGYVKSFGEIKGVNTNAYPEQSILWCSPTTPGGFTVTEPSAPNLKLPVAAVISQGNNGILMVRSDTGSRISSLHDTQIGNAVQDGEILNYNSTTQRWENTPDLDVPGYIIDPTITGTITEDVYTITDSAAFEVSPRNGSVQLVTLTANRTPKATYFVSGDSVTLMVSDGNAYSVTWTDTTWGPSGVKWVGGTAPTLPTTGYLVIQFWKASSQVYGVAVGVVA